jgi:NAD(P)-dependent dehydrogenase (short-subunit alcohol dehydrogenase family)
MTILITGGASGLGEAITKKMASLGKGTVYFTFNRSTKKAEELEAMFNNCRAVNCDFENEASVSALCERMEAMNLDLLINNAYSGGFIGSHFHKTPATDFAKSFNSNLLPTIAITQAAISAFRKKKSGKIITVLTAALKGNPPMGTSVYVANKAYLEELVKIWATENIKFGITSNGISPSFMPTGFADQMDERLLEQMKEAHPLKKFLTPEEVADAIAFMAQSSSHINGTNVVLNAGMSI